MDFATRFSCSLALINRLPWYGRTLVRAPAEHAVLPRSAPENGACQPVQAQRGDETPQPEQEPSTTLAQSGQIVLMQRVDDDEQDHQGSDSQFYYPPPPPTPVQAGGFVRWAPGIFCRGSLCWSGHYPHLVMICDHCPLLDVDRRLLRAPE